MENTRLLPQLQQVVVFILSEVTKSCVNFKSANFDRIWFGEKLCDFIDNNLLTIQEINNLFGWSWSSGANSYIELYQRRNEVDVDRFSTRSAGEMKGLIMALCTLVAVKYQVRPTFSYTSESDEETVSSKTTSIEKDVTEPTTDEEIEADRFELLYTKLSSFSSFTLSTRAANCIRVDGISVLGDLLSRTEHELLRIPNFGKASLREIKNQLEALNLDVSLCCLTSSEQAEFEHRRWLNECAGQKLYTETSNGWMAPAELVQSLKRLGITEVTQLLTCPIEVLAPLMEFRVDMDKMVYGQLAVFGDLPSLLGLPVPRLLDDDVKIYKPTVLKE